MKISLRYILILSILLISYSALLFSQEKDIIPYLKQIEGGQKDSVLTLLPELIKANPNDPSILFLEALLTENGQDAVPVFNRIISDFPKSRYADAAVYRLFSYYYSLGLYNTASVFLGKLKKQYPASPYIKIAQREVPADNEISTILQNTSQEDKSGNYKFTIQAGAFTNESNAAALKKSFENSGYNSFTKKKSVAGSDFIVVFVGEFKDRDEADSFLQIVNKRFKLNGRVVPLN